MTTTPLPEFVPFYTPSSVRSRPGVPMSDAALLRMRHVNGQAEARDRGGLTRGAKGAGVHPHTAAVTRPITPATTPAVAAARPGSNSNSHASAAAANAGSLHPLLGDTALLEDAKKCAAYRGRLSNIAERARLNALLTSERARYTTPTASRGDAQANMRRLAREFREPRLRRRQHASAPQSLGDLIRAHQDARPGRGRGGPGTGVGSSRRQRWHGSAPSWLSSPCSKSMSMASLNARAVLPMLPPVA